MMTGGDAFLNRMRQAVKESAAHVAEYAAENHRFKAHTGMLERSIRTETGNDGFRGIVFLDESIAPYGVFVHNGTRPHTIVPKKKKALRWISNSDFIFAKVVHHPGTKKDPFLYDALDSQEGEVVKIFEHYTELAKEDIADELTGG